MDECLQRNEQTNWNLSFWVSRNANLCFQQEIDLEDFILLLFPSFTAFCQTWRKEIKTRIKAGRVWPNQLALKCWLFCNLGVWKTALKTKPENADIITALVSGGSWNPSYHPTTIPPIPNPNLPSNSPSSKEQKSGSFGSNDGSLSLFHSASCLKTANRSKCLRINLPTALLLVPDINLQQRLNSDEESFQPFVGLLQFHCTPLKENKSERFSFYSCKQKRRPDLDNQRVKNVPIRRRKTPPNFRIRHLRWTAKTTFLSTTGK